MIRPRCLVGVQKCRNSHVHGGAAIWCLGSEMGTPWVTSPLWWINVALIIFQFVGDWSLCIYVCHAYTDDRWIPGPVLQLTIHDIWVIYAYE
jgi:hypothetical protein